MTAKRELDPGTADAGSQMFPANRAQVRLAEKEDTKSTTEQMTQKDKIDRHVSAS